MRLESLPNSVAIVASACFIAVGCGRAPERGLTPEVSKVANIRTALVGASGESGGAAKESTGTGWGTLKGRLVYDGEPPVMPPMNEALSKDAATCAPGGQPPKSEYLLVDPSSKGIANVVLFARKASRVHESAEPREEPVVFDQKNCVFLTRVVGVTVGQPLDIRNSDNVSHNTSIAGQNVFNEMIPVGQSTVAVPKKEESAPVEVRCNVHPWMLAYLLPRKNGYFAVTKADGTFEIPNLPAGEKVEIQVWHERAAGGKGALVLRSPEAEALDWDDKGRFEVTLEPDETRDLQLTVPAAAFSS
jgi:hypothetical protein